MDRRGFLGRLGRAIIAAPVMVFTPQPITVPDDEERDDFATRFNASSPVDVTNLVMSLSSVPLLSQEAARDALGIEWDTVNYGSLKDIAGE